MFGHYLSVFFHDDKVGAVFILIALDLLLGVGAALKLGTFRLAYVADFLKTDVLGKVLPYFVLYAADIASGDADILIPGLDLGVLSAAAYGVLVAALVGSIISSLSDLGLNIPTPTLAGGEKTPAAVDGNDQRTALKTVALPE